MGVLSVLIADDQALMRTGFRLILEAEPDLVLVDVRMPGVDGITATGELAGPGVAHAIPVLILTTFDLDEYVFEALRAGASGFLLKDVPCDRLVDGVRVVAAGEALLAPTVTRRMIHRLTLAAPVPARAEAVAALTPREREVLVLMARGLSNAEIADELVLEPTTVKTHVGRVLMKLGLRDRVQVVVFAYEQGPVRASP